MKNDQSHEYRRHSLIGGDRWASTDEIKSHLTRVNLHEDTYPTGGISFLSDSHEAYVDGADNHTMVFGATGSKKTRLFVMPLINTLIKAGESFVATDPKGELFAQTSGLAKQKGYRVIALDFRDIGRGDRWNPLSIPYDLWHSGQQCEAGSLLSDIVKTVSEPITNTARDIYWPEAAQELGLAGLYTLMECAPREQANMRSFSKLSSYGMVDPLKELSGMMAEDSIAAINYQSTIGIAAQVTLSGIVATLYGMLKVFVNNENLSSLMAESTFDLTRFGHEKSAVYLIIPDEKNTLNFVVTMFVKQVYEMLIRKAQQEAACQLPIRVNFVLDEFCNIPRIPEMSNMISAGRSRNIRFHLVVQSLHQLRGKYGEDAETIKSNCTNWMFLFSRELDLLNDLSTLCGDVINPEGGRRRLITIPELQRLSKEEGEALVLYGRNYPFITKLPDISEYTMFGCYDKVELPTFDVVDVPCYSVIKLLKKIQKHEALPPFASEEHKIEQARDILREELTAREGLPSRSSNPFSGFFNRHMRDEEEEAEKPMTEEQKAARELTRWQHIKEAKEAAHVRIAKLMGQDFADNYIDNVTVSKTLSIDDGNNGDDEEED